MSSNRIKAFAIATIVFFVAATTIWLAYVWLGGATGVIAMCSTAPEWWFYIYLALVVLVPIGGILTAIVSFRWYLLKKGSTNEE